MKFRLFILFFLIISFRAFPQEVCKNPSQRRNFERIINAKGEFISLNLKKDGFPAITFYDLLNKKLVYADARLDGSWRMKTIADASSDASMESILLSADEPVILFTNGNGVYYFNNGTNLIHSEDGSYARGISAINTGGDLFVSYYFVSRDRKRWKVGLRKGENFVLLNEGWVHQDIQEENLIRGVSTAIILSGDLIHVLYTNLESGTLDETILDKGLKIKSSSTIFKLLPATKKFIAQWMKVFQEGNLFGITFYNTHPEVSCVSILINNGIWSSPEYPLKRGGFGIFSYPFLIDGSLSIFAFDGEYGSAVFGSKFEKYWKFKRLESKGFTGMWISAVKIPPDDFIFAFASADREIIEVHYLSDY